MAAICSLLALLPAEGWCFVSAAPQMGRSAASSYRSTEWSAMRAIGDGTGMARHVLARMSGWAEDEDAEAIDDARTFKRSKGVLPSRKKKTDQRDRLLYDVTEVTPPPKSLGRFRLEPNLACGDMMMYKDKTFVIKKVSYRYNYIGGAYRMVGKGASVKETSRDSVEAFMRRMLPRCTLAWVEAACAGGDAACEIQLET